LAPVGQMHVLLHGPLVRVVAFEYPQDGYF
jgi:hypothetical protein